MLTMITVQGRLEQAGEFECNLFNLQLPLDILLLASIIARTIQHPNILY